MIRICNRSRVRRCPHDGGHDSRFLSSRTRSGIGIEHDNFPVIQEPRKGDRIHKQNIMKIKILIDNISGYVRDIRNTNSESQKQLKGEWGLCVYTEYNGKHILLDTGASPLFTKNAADMGINLSAIDAGVLSHAHYDHANGMQDFFKKNDHAKFYLRESAGENCYHSYIFVIGHIGFSVTLM